MKILFIDVNCKHGSTGKLVYSLYQNALKDGNESIICYGRGKLIDEDNIYRFSSNIEVYFHALMTRLTGLTGRYSFFSTKKLISIMKKFKPDVVHIHELHGYFVNIKPVIDYLKKNNIRTVWTFHCEFMYTGKCGHSYECEKWKTNCGNCPHLKDYPATMFFDFTGKMHNEKKALFDNFNNLVIVNPSNWLTERVKLSFLGNKDIVTIYNGIDLQNTFFPRETENLRRKLNLSDEKIVLSLAPDLMNEHKGGKHILQLARRMKQENVKFILVGVTNLDETFEDNVIAIGRTENQAQLAEYYSLADVTVITSKRETFSLIAAESLACCTPVVGFDSGAPSEIVPKELGKFVDYGDTENLGHAVRDVLNMGELKGKCRAYAEEHFDENKMYKNYMKVYLG